MNAITYRVVDVFPEPAYSALVTEAFSDYEESQLLSDVAHQEDAARSGAPHSIHENTLRIGAFRGGELVGWTFARPEGASLLCMINSGVAPAERRNGIYSELVRLVIDHARSRGYTAILSRHAASNNAVIIAKLKLGFFVSGFEYSEVHGPLVRLTYLIGSLRRTLYQARSTPIRRAKPKT
ncbi:GNAT family N-acetyltransferase [Rubrivivax sp. RP6-9]|uniref:GNAT family N-acetyltransferase n=1 Tax=Rubrivivax sp. RP6-9 TaxID=3415750 RepID=UPI003CC57338